MLPKSFIFQAEGTPTPRITWRREDNKKIIIKRKKNAGKKGESKSLQYGTVYLQRTFWPSWPPMSTFHPLRADLPPLKKGIQLLQTLLLKKGNLFKSNTPFPTSIFIHFLDHPPLKVDLLSTQPGYEENICYYKY